jgi:hypothetical protein
VVQPPQDHAPAGRRDRSRRGARLQDRPNCLREPERAVDSRPRPGCQRSPCTGRRGAPDRRGQQPLAVKGWAPLLGALRRRAALRGLRQRHVLDHQPLQGQRISLLTLPSALLQRPARLHQPGELPGAAPRRGCLGDHEMPPLGAQRPPLADRRPHSEREGRRPGRLRTRRETPLRPPRSPRR